MITLKSLQFEMKPQDGTLAEASTWASMGLNAMSLIQLAVLSFVALLLGLFVVRPILTSRPQEALAGPDGMAGALPPPGPGESNVLTGEIDERGFDASALPVVNYDQGLPMFGDAMGPNADPVERLRRLIEDRQEETVEILRAWMEEPGEKA